MQHARRRTKAPDEPDLDALAATLEDIGRRLLDLHAGAAQVIDAARDGVPLPDGLDRRALALLSAGLRHAGGESAGAGELLKQIRDGQRLSAMTVAVIRGQEQQRLAATPPARRHAHRKPRRNPNQLTLIPGDGKGAAVMSGVTAAGALVRHSHVLQAVLATGAAASIAVAAPAIVAPSPQSPVRAASHAAASLPVLPANAIPMLLPQSSYAGRHRAPGAPDAKRATQVPSAPPVVVAAPSSPVPSAAPSAVAGGTLDVQTAACAIGLSGRCTVSFVAIGGPVQWQASASDPALNLSGYGGTLGAGQSFAVTVTVRAGLAGAGVITISAGGQSAQIPVTWAAVPGLNL